RIGANTDIDAAGSVSVVADASVTPAEIVIPILGLATGLHVTSMTIGAAISTGGADSGAGSGAIDVFVLDTLASIGAGADVDAGTDVSVRAVDDTKTIKFVGAIAGSKEGAGIGVGLDVTVIVKTTEAWIEASNVALDPTTVDAGGNIVVDADSSEDAFSLTVNVGVGGGSESDDGTNSVAGAGGAVVLVLITDTRAYAGRDPRDLTPPLGNVVLKSTGSTAIAAHSSTKVDAAAGSAGVNIDGDAFGASVAVVVDVDNTHAFVGEDASVTALGQTAVDVRSGVFGDGGSQDTESVRGLAVTATSYEDELLVAIGAGGAFGDEAIGVGASVTVAVALGSTLAYIAEDADVNAVNTGAHADQGVLLRASDETGIFSAAGGVAIAEGTGIGGAITVAIVENDVFAEAKGGNTINAAGAVDLDAHSHSNVQSLAISVAGTFASDDFAFGAAASGSGNTIDNDVRAVVGTGSTITSGGALSLSAKDDSHIRADSGGAALAISDGDSSAAVGASIAINDIDITARAA